MIWDCKQESTIVSALRFTADTHTEGQRLNPVWGAHAFSDAHKVETFVLPYNMAVNAVSNKLLKSADQYSYLLPLNVVGSFRTPSKEEWHYFFTPSTGQQEWQDAFTREAESFSKNIIKEAFELHDVNALSVFRKSAFFAFGFELTEVTAVMLDETISRMNGDFRSAGGISSSQYFALLPSFFRKYGLPKKLYRELIA